MIIDLFGSVYTSPKTLKLFLLIPILSCGSNNMQTFCESLKSLSHTKNLLAGPTTLKEIYHIRPSRDGFNVEFYLFYYDIDGNNIFKAVDHFFNHFFPLVSG